MAARRFEQMQYSLEKNVVKLYGTIVTSTSGAIASQDCMGAVISKTADEIGRYTIALRDSYQRVLSVSVTVVGATDAAYPIASGIAHILRNVAVSSATVPAFEIQLCRQDTGADAEVLDGASILVEISLSNSSV